MMELVEIWNQVVLPELVAQLMVEQVVEQADMVGLVVVVEVVHPLE